MCLLVCVLFQPGTLLAQESNFQADKAKWVEIEKKIVEIESAIKEGDTSRQKEFDELVEQANQLVDSMRSSAVDALKQDAKNRDALRTLLGIMVNDASQDNDAAALKLGQDLISINANPLCFDVAAESSRLKPSQKEIFYELRMRSDESRADNLPRVKLTTSQGEIELELFENEAPNTVANFISLVEKGFYDDIFFHRVIEGFMAQSGCPEGTGAGGPGYTIACECYQPDTRKHFTGSLSMAKQTARDTGGSQFFLTFKRTSGLDGMHTVFGRIIKGWDTLDNIARTHTTGPRGDIPIASVTKDKIRRAEVIRKREHDYKVRKVGVPVEEEQPKQPPSQPAINDPAESGGGEKQDDGSK